MKWPLSSSELPVLTFHFLMIRDKISEESSLKGWDLPFCDNLTSFKSVLKELDSIQNDGDADDQDDSLDDRLNQALVRSQDLLMLKHLLDSQKPVHGDGQGHKH